MVVSLGFPLVSLGSPASAGPGPRGSQFGAVSASHGTLFHEFLEAPGFIENCASWLLRGASPSLPRPKGEPKGREREGKGKPKGSQREGKGKGKGSQRGARGEPKGNQREPKGSQTQTILEICCLIPWSVYKSKSKSPWGTPPDLKHNKPNRTHQEPSNCRG